MQVYRRTAKARAEARAEAQKKAHEISQMWAADDNEEWMENDERGLSNIRNAWESAEYSARAWERAEEEDE